MRQKTQTEETKGNTYPIYSTCDEFAPLIEMFLMVVIPSWYTWKENIYRERREGENSETLHENCQHYGYGYQ